MRNSGPCYNCGGHHLQLLYHAPPFDSAREAGPVSFSIERCLNCGLVNTLGATAAVIEAAYHRDYYGSAQSKFNGFIEGMLSLAHRHRATQVIQHWRAQPNRNSEAQRLPSVLDIGCGRGQLLSAFAQRGCEVCGLERPEFAEQGTPPSFVHIGQLSDPTFTNHRFDIVVLWHVLEHMETITDLLRLVGEHLEEGGLLVLAVPNFASWQHLIFRKHWFHLDLPRHLVHIEEIWLIEQLEQLGLEIEKCNHLDWVQNSYGFIQSSMNSLVHAPANAYYRTLHHRELKNLRQVALFLCWTLLAVLLTPLAIIESIGAALLRRGATVQIFARNRKKEPRSHD